MRREWRAGADAKKKFDRAQVDEVPFPWDMASVLSCETFSDGCQEFLQSVLSRWFL